MLQAGRFSHPSADIDLPADVYMPLVDSLFGEARSMIIGSTAASLGALVTAWKTGESALYICAGGIVGVTIARALLMKAYACAKAQIRDIETMRSWETRYIVGASAYLGLLGLMCLVAFVATTDPFAHLITFATVLAYMIGVSGRNFANGKLIVVQILCAGLPMCAALIFAGGYYYALLILVLFPFLLTMRFISARLRRTLLDAILGARGMTALAKQFDTALNNMPHGLAMFDETGQLVVLNGRLPEILRVPTGAIQQGMHAENVLDICLAHRTVVQDDAALLRTWFKARARTDDKNHLLLNTGDGRSLSMSVRAMRGGSVVVVEDITLRRLAEEKINHMARFDGLTGLPNRSQFREIMETALKEEPTAGNFRAVLFIDLDQFKQVNDTLGHRQGDLLLSVVAKRLREILEPESIVARFGGDEFIALVRGAKSVDAVGEVGRMIVRQLGHPFQVDSHEIVVGASVGIALMDAHTTSVDQLLKDADTALYEAKADGRGAFRFFEAAMARRAEARRSLETDLRTALATDAFDLHYQPLYDIKSGRFTTCEALLRWHHAKRGWISPAEFIPVAEELGLIVEMGAWVLRQACRECLAWPGHTRVAVNLSTVQFKRSNVVDIVKDALSVSGLSADRLELEITESVLLQDSSGTREALRVLREMGVRLSLDDFGTGYSSLSYLQKFELNKVKIDRSFLTDLDNDGRSMILLRGVAQLSADLGLSVVIEGIETSAQFQMIVAQGIINEVQGFYIARPVPAPILRTQLLEPSFAGRKVA